MSTAEDAVAVWKAADGCADPEEIFRAHYKRVARIIAGVVRDHARAEELAVEVFLKLWRRPEAQGAGAEAWLHRAAVRSGLNELRRQSRRSRYERLFGRGPSVTTPEEILAAAQEAGRVRAVLGAMTRREAGLLVLRGQGLSYDEVAAALQLNPASVGTLLRRAQQAFRKEYVKRYGER